MKFQLSIFLSHCQYQNKKALFTDPIFSEGFGPVSNSLRTFDADRSCDKLIEETNFILNEKTFDNPSGWSKSNRATSASRCHSFRISCFSWTAALHWRNVDHDDDELSSCWCRANDTAPRKRNKPLHRAIKIPGIFRQLKVAYAYLQGTAWNIIIIMYCESGLDLLLCCEPTNFANRKRNKPSSRFLAYSANWRLPTKAH